MCMQVAGVNGNNVPAFTAAGDVVVGSNGRHTVTVLAGADGHTLHSLGTRGAAALQFYNPCGVCVATDNTVFVADYINNRIQALPDLGRAGTATQLGTGGLQGPMCAALTRAEDAIVVRQQGTNRVVVVARSGGAVLRVLLTAADVTYGFSGVAVSSCGVVAAPDHRKMAIVVCSVDGAWKRTIPAALLGGQLQNPCGAAFDSRDRLWLCDQGAKCWVTIEPQ